MILVACSLPCAGGKDASSASAVQQRAKALEVAGAGGGRTVGGAARVAVADEAESPGTLLDRGTELIRKQHWTEAVRVLDAAMSAWEEEAGSKNPETAEAALTLQRLGKALQNSGQRERATSVFGRAVAASEVAFGQESAETVASLTSLGLSLNNQGQHAEAASALAKALRARPLKSKQGVAMAPEDVVENLFGLVTALLFPRPAEGESGLEGALVAVDHVNRLAWRYFVQSLPYQGESVMQEVLEKLRSFMEKTGSDPSAPWDLVISACLFNVGFLQLAILGEYESAAGVLQEAHAIRSTVVGEVHSLTVQAAVSRGWALTLTGKTLLAVDELTRKAKALLDDGQAHAADRLLRQALQQGYDPLGTATYANACFTQHVNMLRGWGTEGASKANDFTVAQINIANDARLTGREQSMKLATTTLARALRRQMEDKAAGGGLLELGPADKVRLQEEIALLQK
eukprot:g11204.t1